MKLDKFWKLAALLNALVIAVLILLVIIVRFVLNMENLEMRYVITMGFIVGDLYDAGSDLYGCFPYKYPVPHRDCTGDEGI